MSRAIVALYRVRGIALYAACATLIGFALAGPLLADVARPVKLALSGLVAIAICLGALAVLLTLFGPRHLPHPEPRVVTPPVRGRWLGMNSPASKSPSHGIRAYGQAYAIDLVHEPEDAARPAFGDGPAMRAPEEYPAFGQPVVAMIDGVVVKASDWRRDHRARSAMLALVYLMVEGSVREFGGPGFIIGNHVTIRGDDGVFATVAHLQRGSATVRVGDTVTAGDQIGRCGNSGNSSEPHVHAQLMDRASPWTGQGIPLAFAGIRIDDAHQAVDAVPANDQHMLV